MQLSPVVLFVYNRPEHTKKTLNALAKNELARNSELFIFSDAAKDISQLENVSSVRALIKEYSNKNLFKVVTIIYRSENLGLANSIISGVTDIISKYGKVIVLEDDLVTSSDFLKFMNQSLSFYASNSYIGSISGYSPITDVPSSYSETVYVARRSSSLGWATWKDRWKYVDWEVKDFKSLRKNSKFIKEFNSCGSDRFDRLRRQVQSNINSWSIRFGYWQHKNNKVTIFPVNSRILNIGDDGSGVHSSKNATYNSNFYEHGSEYELTNPELHTYIEKEFKRVYSGGILSRIARFMRNNGMSSIEKLIKNAIHIFFMR